MFGHIITEVCGSCAPVGSELFLILSAPKPMKSHVHCFQFFQDVVVDDAKCRGVVDLDGGWGLWMAHFRKELSLGYGLLRVDEQCASFGFGRRGHDCFDDLRDGEDGAIVGWIFVVLGEEKMAACSAAGFGFREIGGVAVSG